MKITKIQIEDIGQHSSTVIDVASHLTLIEAANGTGKTTFSNSIAQKDFFGYDLDLLLNENSQITVIDDNGKKYRLQKGDGGSLVYKGSDDKKAPTIQLFNDDTFLNLSRRHNVGNALVSINKVTLELESFRKFRKIITKHNAMDKRMQFLRKPTISDMKYYKNDHLLQKKHSSFPSFVDSAKLMRKYTLYKPGSRGVERYLNREKTILHHIVSKLKNTQFKYGRGLNFMDHIDGETKNNLEFLIKNTSSVTKSIIDNAINWYWIMHSSEFKREERFIMRNEPHWEKYNIDTEVNSNEEVLNLYEKALVREENSLKKFHEKLAKKLNIIIKNSHIRDKFYVNKNLSILNMEGKKIILSTGELRLLNLIMFFEKDINQDLIILDDPLTSIDSEFALIFLRYLQDKITEIGKPIIMLTHSRMVVDIFIKLFTHDNPKNVKNIKNKWVTWTLDNKNIVESFYNTRPVSHVQSLVQDFEYQTNSILKLKSARTILEFLCYVQYGVSSLQGIMMRKKDEYFINHLNKKLLITRDLWDYLNFSSHYDSKIFIHNNKDSITVKESVKEMEKIFIQFGLIKK